MTRLVMVVDRVPMYSTTFLAAKFKGLLERGWDVHVVCRESDPEQEGSSSEPVSRDCLHASMSLQTAPSEFSR